MEQRVRFVDTHAHMHVHSFHDDREQVFQRAWDAGVGRIIEVGIDMPSNREVVNLAEQYEQVYAVVGIHPNSTHEAPSDWLGTLQELAKHPKVVAIGETGLDYYRDHAPHDVQRRLFIEQLGVARACDLPVVIHCRDAYDDTLEVLREHAQGHKVVLHSFSGTWKYAKMCLDCGFVLSFSGPVTFSKAKDTQEVARRAPIGSLLTETDCPFLSPHPFRGKRNEPARVRIVAEQVAQLRGMKVEKVAAAVWENMEQVFGARG